MRIVPVSFAVVLSLQLVAVLSAVSCSAQSAAPALSQIKCFEECAQAGYPVLKSFPAQCILPDKRRYTQGNPIPSIMDGLTDNKGLNPKPICKNLCGDGRCQEIVCLAEGCPCAESKASCPADCK